MVVYRTGLYYTCYMTLLSFKNVVESQGFNTVDCFEIGLV